MTSHHSVTLEAQVTLGSPALEKLETETLGTLGTLEPLGTVGAPR